MEAKAELKKYRESVDGELARFFAKKLSEMQKFGPSGKNALKSIRDLTLAGGKRVRAAFMFWGYLGAGGSEIEKITEASMSIELTNIFLLIHDDIIDRDDFRHGVTTIHKKYEKLARRFYKKTDPCHFGNSMAMVIGDMAAALGNEIIFNSCFKPEIVIRALDKLQDIVTTTVSGEIFDVMLEAKGKASEREVLEVFENKTAKYTVEGPLHLGAMLAGADEKILKAYSEYAVPVGIAFQIQDDILGAFGNEKKLGKPVCSDLREGKQTLLVIKALEKGNGQKRKLIKNLLGKKDVTNQEVEMFRDAVRETGSLEYSQNLAKTLVKKGKKALEKAEIKEETKEFLTGIADYIVNREV
ncbi:MAG: polyprenyl synthetase family protein [Parcubacteria group bacterium]